MLFAIQKWSPVVWIAVLLHMPFSYGADLGGQSSGGGRRSEFVSSINVQTIPPSLHCRVQHYPSYPSLETEEVTLKANGARTFTLTYARYVRPSSQQGLGERKEYLEVDGLKECHAVNSNPLLISCMDLKWLGNEGRSIGINVENVKRNRLTVNTNGDYVEDEFASLEAFLGYLIKDKKGVNHFASKEIAFAPSDCNVEER